MAEIPLSRRVAAPSTAEPGRVDGIRWRPASLEDVDELVTLYRAGADANRSTFAITREELVKELSHSYIDLSHDTLVAVEESTGSIVALGAQLLLPVQDTLVRSTVEGAGVHPAHRGRGIGRALFTWHEQRAMQQLASSDETLPGWMQAWADDAAPENARLFARYGLEPARWYIGLSREVRTPIDVGNAPLGIRVENMAASYAADARVARDAAYRDVWGAQPTTVEQWNAMLDLEMVSFDHSFVAVSSADEVVGVLLTWIAEEDWADLGFTGGYVGVLGVVPQWRGRGVATALLSYTIQSLHERGLQRCYFEVDIDNPSGAIGLFTRLGFDEYSRSAKYVRRF